MKLKRMWILLAMAAVTCSGSFPATASASLKRTLRGNMTVVYKTLPGRADSIGEMFSHGMFYGRLRVNSFLWNWDRETAGKTKDNWAVGAGGSMIFKSAYYKGVGITAGFYTVQDPWHMSGEDYRYAKAGKDMFSRDEVAADGGYGMSSLAQAYLKFRLGKTSLRAGRQLFESLLTASNDTKMIPNAFQGISLESADIENTRIEAAWFDAQKLRDHTGFHHVLAFGDDPAIANAGWTQNDDSAMPKGLTLSKLRAAGIEDQLLVFQVENRSIPNLRLLANVTDVPDLVGSATVEANYTLILAGRIRITPGVRYLSQFDNGGGIIGGASLKGKVSAAAPRGYSDPTSLSGSMLAARIAVSRGSWDGLVGYSSVSDDADLVAPWRGFPTAGYTRAMGQYNWYANTKTWMLQAGWNLAKAGVVPGFSVKAKYALQDFDDRKPDVPADSNVLNIDFLEKVPTVPGLEFKLRTAFVKGKSDTRDMNGALKPDPSYNEVRLEMNYLF